MLSTFYDSPEKSSVYGTEVDKVTQNRFRIHIMVILCCQLQFICLQFNRRHHCRRCGRVVCAACSTKRSQVRGVSARTCDECYEQIFGTR